MGDWPQVRGILAAPVLIVPTSICSVQNAISSLGGQVASAAWPAANRAIYIPFRLDVPMLAVAMSWCNGTAVSGNLDVGLYDHDGTRLVSKGSTAQAGTNTLQTADITDTYLPPGVYYLAMALDNTTGTVFRTTAASVELIRIMGLVQQASAFPLPATAAFATMASAYLPHLGVTTRSVV